MRGPVPGKHRRCCHCAQGQAKRATAPSGQGETAAIEVICKRRFHFTPELTTDIETGYCVWDWHFRYHLGQEKFPDPVQLLLLPRHQILLLIPWPPLFLLVTKLFSSSQDGYKVIDLDLCNYSSSSNSNQWHWLIT